MNQAHYHLVLNHLPIIIPGIGLLVMVGGLVVRSEVVKRVAFSIFILGTLAAIPAYFTGEGAEEVVENLQGVSESMMETHEDTASTFAILSYILGAIALIGLWANWKQKSFSNILVLFTVAFSLVVLFFAKQTGTTGGEIRHTEIRAGNAQNTGTPGTGQQESNEDDD